MASGHVNRTNRPNTWLHRPTWGNRPAFLWIAERFGVLRFRLMVKRGPHLRPQASEGEAQLVGKVRFAGPLSFWHPPRWRCRSFGPDCLEAWRTSRPRRKTRVRGDRRARAFLSYGGTAQEVAAAGMVCLEPDDGPGARCRGAPGQESRSRPRHPLSRRLQPGRQDDLHRPPYAAIVPLPRPGHRHWSLSHFARGGREDPDRSARPALPPCAPDRDACRADRRAGGGN